MQHRISIIVLVVSLCSASILLTGCASGVRVTNTLPDELKKALRPIESEEGVRLVFTPIPVGEELQVSIGAMDYSLNRVFEGMLVELLRTKFDTLNVASPNIVNVQINYLNLQQENFRGTLHRMDMAVIVKVNNGYKSVEREFQFSQQAEYEGYGLRSGQIRNLLLRFTLAINRMIDQQFLG